MSCFALRNMFICLKNIPFVTVQLCFDDTSLAVVLLLFSCLEDIVNNKAVVQVKLYC